MRLPSSDAEMVLLHNPRCSKSRATLALLEEHVADFAIREYLKDPLSVEELTSLAARLGKPLREVVRTKEKEFAESGCTADSSESDLATAVAAHPILMERPILVCGQRAAIGRPPEDVLALL